MPNVAPIMKIQKCQSYGANVIVHGDDMKEAKFHAMSLAKEKGLTYINGYGKMCLLIFSIFLFIFVTKHQPCELSFYR